MHSSHAHQVSGTADMLICMQVAGERQRAGEALRACQGGATAEAERLRAAAADAQGSARRAQAALEACEGARSACQARLEGMGQGSERCWEALEAERVRAPGRLSRTMVMLYHTWSSPCPAGGMQLFWRARRVNIPAWGQHPWSKLQRLHEVLLLLDSKTS